MSKYERKPHGEAAKSQQAAAIIEPVKVEIEMEEEDPSQRVLRSSGEFWVRYSCATDHCRACFEVLTQGVLQIKCANCGSKMRTDVRKAD